MFFVWYSLVGVLLFFCSAQLSGEIQSNSQQDVGVFRTVDVTGKLQGAFSQTFEKNVEDVSLSIPGFLNFSISRRQLLTIDSIRLKDVTKRIDSEIRSAFEGLNRFSVQGFNYSVKSPDNFISNIVSDRFDEAMESIEGRKGSSRSIRIKDFEAVKGAFLVAFPEIIGFNISYSAKEPRRSGQGVPDIEYKVYTDIHIRIYNPGSKKWEKPVKRVRISSTAQAPATRPALSQAIEQMMSNEGFYRHIIKERFPVTSGISEISQDGLMRIDAGEASDISPGDEFVTYKNKDKSGRTRQYKTGRVRVRDVYGSDADAYVLWGNPNSSDSVRERPLRGIYYGGRLITQIYLYLRPSEGIRPPSDFPIGSVYTMGVESSTEKDYGYGFSILTTSSILLPLSSSFYSSTGDAWLFDKGIDFGHSLDMIDTGSFRTIFGIFANSTVGLAYTFYFGRFSLDLRGRIGLSAAIILSTYKYALDSSSSDSYDDLSAAVGIGPVVMLDIPMSVQATENLFIRWSIGTQFGVHFWFPYSAGIHPVGVYLSLGIDWRI